MKMAKASEADLKMAMELSSIIESIESVLYATVPSDIEPEGGYERFCRDDDEQCGRVLRHLLETASRGSISRVVFGMCVLLDPENRVVDPDADTLEHHPDRKDSDRLRWMLADHEDKAVRDKCRALFDRLPMMSYSAGVAAIDAEMAEGDAARAA